MNFRYKPNNKQIFELAFSFIVVVLFIIKGCTSTSDDGITKEENPAENPVPAVTETPATADATDTMAMAALRSDSVLYSPTIDPNSLFGQEKHKIYSVSSYERAFPDLNDVQLKAARHHGIEPQQTREGVAALSGTRLVNVEYSPYYTIAELTSSSPYLIPRAQHLLNRIGRNFIDSLLIKHIPPSLIIVTSVTRSIEDISKLQTVNVNAVEGSCHSYGTTFDISYLKYQSLPKPDGTPMRQARDDTLKWVLSEVLNDLRQAGACYVKHERKQGCFHITVR